MTDTSFILWLQQFSNGFLDSFFTIITSVGNPEYYMIAFPLLYWCVNKRQAFRFTLFFIISMYINSAVKEITSVARPASSEVRIVYNESTYGTSSFPSGHTQGTASFWGYLAHQIKNKYFTAIAAIITLLVGVSRMYLGLHFPIDIVGGLVFAIVIFLLFNLLYERAAKKLENVSWNKKMAMAVILPPFLLIPPGQDNGMLAGFVMGLIVGYLLENRYLDFKNSGTLVKQVAKFVIGIVVLFALRVLLKEVLSAVGLTAITEQGSDAVRYLVIGLWASYLAPLLFVKVGLSDKNKTDNITKDDINALSV